MLRCALSVHVTDTLCEALDRLDSRMAIVYARGMELPRNAIAAKNLLIGAGAYYLSQWVAPPLGFGFWKLTKGIIYRGDFAGAVLMPLVTQLPEALVAAGVGAAVAWLVESERPLRWAIFPALLYATFGYLGYHWVRPTPFIYRFAEVIGALFPAVTCVVGGIVAVRRRASLRATLVTPDSR